MSRSCASGHAEGKDPSFLATGSDVFVVPSHPPVLLRAGPVLGT